MSDRKEIVVKDSCILFDLIDLDIIDDFFKLDIKAFTTPQVIAEITCKNQRSVVLNHISNKNLTVDSLGRFEFIIEIFNSNTSLSFTDSSVLELAIRKKATLLSSDKSLRKESSRCKINVRGVLWVFEELTKNNVVPISRAIEKLKIYPKINNRAPGKEISILIGKLEKLGEQ